MENSQFNFRPSYVMHDPTQPGKSNLPVPTDTGARNLGFRSGAANPAITPHEANAVAAGAALGEPTSFRGGAGAPAPVAIMRGMRTTFQNPAADQGPGGGYVQTPGSSPQEYATPVQAGQAWNQGMRSAAVGEGDRRGFTTPEATLDAQYGGFRAPGQTTAEIQATKEGPGQQQERLMRGQLFQQQQEKMKREETDVLHKQIEQGLIAHVNKHFGGTYDKAGKMVPPTDQNVLRARDNAIDYAKEKGDLESGKNYMTWDQQLRALHPQVYLKAMQQSPADWDVFVRGMGPTLPKVSMASGRAAQLNSSSGLGPEQLQGEIGQVPSFVAPAPPPTQPTGALRDLTESMGY